MFRRGNATLVVPIMSGTRWFPRPAKRGTMTKNTSNVSETESELVEAVGAEHTPVRLRELQPEDECHEAREAEEDEPSPDVEDPDALVIRRDEPARHSAALPGR